MKKDRLISQAVFVFVKCLVVWGSGANQQGRDYSSLKSLAERGLLQPEVACRQGITPARSRLQRGDYYILKSLAEWGLLQPEVACRVGDYSGLKSLAERGLLQLEVACVEAVVESLITDELVVGASLNDSALVKHHNYVGVLDC